MRPSLRSDSLISVSFDWKSSLAGMHVGWIWVKHGFAIERAALVRPPRRGDVRRLGVGREEEDVAVPAGGEHHRVRGERRDRAGDEVPGDDPAGAPVLRHEVEHLGAGVQLDVAEVHLASERLVGAEQQLLAGLTARVERARHLRAAERAVVEQAAVLARERHALGHALVDDVHRHLREAVHVRLPGAEVAALHRVVEQALHGVAVVPVVLRRVDAALRGDRVRATRRVVEREHRDAVAELAERGRRAGTGEARAHDEHVELPLVGGVDELDVELVVVPLLGDRALGDVCVERTDHETTPVTTKSGKLTLAMPISRAKPIANLRRASFHFGLLSPRLWNIDQAPWKMWMASAMLATM